MSKAWIENEIIVIMTSYHFPSRTGSMIVVYNRMKHLSKHHHDLRNHLLPLMNNCRLVDELQWDCPNPGFNYLGKYQYTFATFVIKRRQYAFNISKKLSSMSRGIITGS
jgi:hypothetical protein